MLGLILTAVMYFYVFLWTSIYSSFYEKLASTQYNACVALIEAITSFSKEKIYQELGLESLQIRRWYRKLCIFYKIYKIKILLTYIIQFPQLATITPLEIRIKILILKPSTIFFKNSFFPSATIAWNKLDSNLRRCDSCNVFESNILYIRPSTRFMIALILSKSNILQKMDLVLVTCENIDSSIASRTQLILYVTAIMMLNLPFIFPSTIPYIVINNAHAHSLAV